MIRYIGVFASNSRLRKKLVPQSQTDAYEEPEPCKHPTAKKHWSWAKLIRRVFEIHVRECPRCKSQMQTISFTDAKVIWDILGMSTFVFVQQISAIAHEMELMAL